MTIMVEYYGAFAILPIEPLILILNKWAMQPHVVTLLTAQSRASAQSMIIVEGLKESPETAVSA